MRGLHVVIGHARHIVVILYGLVLQVNSFPVGRDED